MGVNADTSRSVRRPGSRRVEAPGSDPHLTDVVLGTETAGAEAGSMAPAGAETATDLHIRYGNAVVEAALAGGEGFYADVAGEMASGIAGMSTEAGPTPNHMVAARISRHAQHKSVGQVLQTLPQSSGFGLDADQRERFEEVFGHDFGHVRIHTDGVAAEAAHQLFAHAFALGSEVYFASGNFAPGTKKGDRLLAHELTHVVQHDENRLPSTKEGEDQVSSPSDPTEREAYHNEGVILAKLLNLDREQAVQEQADSTSQAPGVLGQVEASRGGQLPPAILEQLTARLGEGAAAGLSSATSADLKELARLMGAGTFDVQSLERAGLLGQAGAAVSSLAEGLLGRLSGLLGSDATEDRATAEASTGQEEQASASEREETSRATEAQALGAGDEAQRAQQTEQLVRPMLAALHLPAGSVQIRVDEAAQQRLQMLGTRGLMEGGDILLDPTRFDPSTSSGKELVAHEMIHVAQQDLEPHEAGGDVSAGSLAEAEAHYAAERFVHGGAMPDLMMGLPSGHQAMEGSVSAESLKGLLEGYSGQLEGYQQGQPPKPEAATKPEGGGSENRAKKLERYKEGVESVADLVEDIPAFEELVDAIDDGESTSGHRANIRASSQFKDLAQMWRGAQNGGEDRASMESSFTAELQGRGNGILFDDEDKKKAFGMVLQDVKASAEQCEGEDEAKANLSNAQDGAGQGVQGPGGSNASEGGDAGGESNAAASLAAAGDVGALMETDPGEYQEISGMDSLATIGAEGGPLTKIKETKNNQEQMAALNVSGGYDEHMNRFSQVSGAIGQSMLVGAESGGMQLFDTLVLDTLGDKADQFTNKFVDNLAAKSGTQGTGALGKSSGKLKMIGPAISLIKGGAWKEEFWVGEKAFYNQSLEGASQGVDKLCNIDDTLAKWDSAKGVEKVGVVLAAMADLFGGLHDIIKGVQDLVSTLSALAYVAGGLLIILGLALLWLAGIGAPMVTAGGWLTRAGQILARVNTALDPVVLALSTLSFVFRTAASFIVPADMFAEQLGGVKDSGEKFATAAANKMADSTGQKVKENIAAGAVSRSKEADSSEADADGVSKADSDASEAQQAQDKNEADVQKAADEGASLRDKAKAMFQDADILGAMKHGASETGDAMMSGTKSTFAGLGAPIQAIRKGVALMQGTNRPLYQGEVWGSIKEAGQIITSLRPTAGGEADRSRMAAEGLAGIVRLEGALEKGNADIAKAKVDIKQLETDIASTPDDHPHLSLRKAVLGDLLVRAKGRLEDADSRLVWLQRDAALLKKGFDMEAGQRAADQTEADGKTRRDAKKGSENSDAEVQKKLVEYEQVNDELGNHQARFDADSGKKESLTELKTRIEGKPFLQVDLDGRTLRCDKFHSNPDGTWTVHDSETSSPIIVEVSQIRGPGTAGKAAERLALAQESGLDPVQLEAQQARKAQLEAELRAATGFQDGEITRERIEQARGRESSQEYIDGTSGNATGAVGSAYRSEILEPIYEDLTKNWDLYQSVMGEVSTSLKDLPTMAAGFADTLEQTASEGGDSEEQGAGEQEVQQPVMPADLKSSAETWAQEAMKGQHAAVQIGLKQEILGQMAGMTCPQDLTEVEVEADKAVAADKSAREAHEHAVMCFDAENTMGALAAQSQALADGPGEQIKQAAQATQEGTEKAKCDEEQRNAVLQGSQADIASPDSAMSSTVADMIVKMSSHSGDFDEQPDGGSGDAGAKGGDSQQQAKDSAAGGKKEGIAASEGQKQVLDQTISGVQEAGTAAGTDQEGLYSKQEAELDILAQVQGFKAASLAKREEERAKGEEHAGNYTDKVNELSTWASEYNTKQAQYDALSWDP